MILRFVARLSALAWMGVVGAMAPCPAEAQKGNTSASDCSTLAMTLRCSSTAPLETPVVPPVYCSTATSSALTSGLRPDLSNQGIVMIGAGGGATYRKSPNAYEKPSWEVTIKLDSGTKRVVTVAYEPFVREGDRVRIAGNSLELID